MKPKILIAAFVLFALFVVMLGCTQGGAQNQPTLPNGQPLPFNPNDFASDLPPMDPAFVCPYECCVDDNYYVTPCRASSDKCAGHKCVPKNPYVAPPAEQKHVLADNEVYPGVFINVLNTKTSTTEFNPDIYRTYQLIGSYLMPADENGTIYSYEDGNKLIIIEMSVENRALDEEYSRAEQNYDSPVFYIADASGTEYMETGFPPQDFAPKVEYYSDRPYINKGETKTVFISFLVPNSFTYKTLLMKHDQHDNIVDVSRIIQFPLQ